jgi:lysophospholipase L1-like esterase
MNWETYLAFGDSITIGARTYLGYPEIVGHQLSIKLNKQWNVINHAVSGFKAIDLARYIDLNFASLKLHQASVITILIGTNDVKENTTLTDFRIALNQIFIKAKLLNNKHVIVFHIPAFHEGIMYPYKHEMNNTIFDFNKAIAEIAAQHQIRCFEFKHTIEHFVDGVHLNHNGNENFANQISAYILKDKGLNIE